MRAIGQHFKLDVTGRDAPGFSLGSNFRSQSVEAVGYQPFREASAGKDQTKSFAYSSLDTGNVFHVKIKKDSPLGGRGLLMKNSGKMMPLNTPATNIRKRTIAKIPPSKGESHK